jgi:hypothetical protein
MQDLESEETGSADHRLTIQSRHDRVAQKKKCIKCANAAKAEKEEAYRGQHTVQSEDQRARKGG